MSTLTSSPSPAASPRAAFHLQRSSSSYSATSPSLTSSVTSSPKLRWSHVTSGTSSGSQRGTYATPTLTTNPSRSGTRPPKETAVESGRGEAQGRYTDAGTQYSPEGYPPTAGPHLLTTQVAGQPPLITLATTATPTSAGKKRKVDSPEPMSASAPAQPASAQRLEPPPEPEVRRDPSAPQSGVVAGPSNQPNRNAEPPEARSTHGHSSAPKRSKPDPSNTKIMPILYQFCNNKDLGHLISAMLMELIRINDDIPLRDGRLTRFHSRAPPGISVSNYLQRLIHHATLSPPILLSMVYYIDRLCQEYSAFTINSLTVHRFLITAATVAAKGLSDSFWTNPTYAQIGGIPVSELATLELEFLEKVKWRIVPQPEILEDYYRSLVNRTEGYMLEGSNEMDETSDSSSLDESDDAEEAGNGEEAQDSQMKG